tara:strand:+ start:1522 stop:2838 length:1317 start_codon:yes stop_codon:yes gene_type:complete
MEEFFIKAAQLILSLSILVVLHELGHFIPARLFKTRVEKFYLFFNPWFSLFKKKIGETEYGIGWLPLGGYVKISGMIDESLDTEQMEKDPQPWEFRSKPAWQRLIIMLGGVTVNIILGFAIYMMIMFIWGKTILPSESIPMGLNPSPIVEELGFEKGDKILYVDGKKLDNVLDINTFLFLRDVKAVTVKNKDGVTRNVIIPKGIGKRMFESGQMIAFSPFIPPIIDSVVPNSSAMSAGLQKGDLFKKVNGIEVMDWTSFRDKIQSTKNENITIGIERNKRPLEVSLKPNEIGQIGVSVKIPDISFENKKLSLTESIVEGFNYGYWTLHDYIYQFKYIFSKKGAQQLGGFGTIGSIFPSSWNWKGFWHTTALLSIILAFMNVLPIPALDGGHVMFLFYEMISGKKPNDKFMEYAQMFGFFLLLALVIYANGNDIYRALS